VHRALHDARESRLQSARNVRDRRFLDQDARECLACIAAAERGRAVSNAYNVAPTE